MSKKHNKEDTNNEQKKIWNEEAAQLKKDLANKKKTVQRREVPIRVAKPGQAYAEKPSSQSSSTKISSKPVNKGSAASDDLLRKQLGL